jgi:hypothetical protein
MITGLRTSSLKIISWFLVACDVVRKQREGLGTTWHWYTYFRAQETCVYFEGMENNNSSSLFRTLEHTHVNYSTLHLHVFAKLMSFFSAQCIHLVSAKSSLKNF